MIGHIALALFVLTLSANAAELSIETAGLAPDKSAALAVNLTASGEAPTGFQFDLEYDAAALDLSVEAGGAAKQASKTLQFRELQPGKLRVLIIGFNRNTIADGILALIHVTYKGTESGRSFPLHMTAQSGTDADAKPVAVTGKDGSVTVGK
jgi:Cohesin domain